jgi:putative endonuclease
VTSNSQVFGKDAEVAAEQYLRHQGYRILGRNVRFSNGELDIVAQQQDTIVFVEVKARRTAQFGGASYAVSPKKQQRLIHLAAQYLAQHELSHRSSRFDVMLYQCDDQQVGHVEHLVNAFELAGNDGRW